MRPMHALVASLHVAAAYQYPSQLPLWPSRHAAHRHPAATCVDADTLRDIAIYDTEMEERLRDMKSRVDSAEFREVQQRQLVETAQKTLWEQNEKFNSLRAEVEAAKAEATAAKEELETAKEGAKSLSEQLEGETRKKDMHHEKAKEFYAELKAAKKELDELRAANKEA